MGKIEIGKLTLIAIILGYILLVSVVTATLVLPLEKPTYIDITASGANYVINGVLWIPDIETKTFSQANVNLTYTGGIRIVTISVSFWNSVGTEIAEGILMQDVTVGTDVYMVTLTWDIGLTTDDISTGRVMII